MRDDKAMAPAALSTYSTDTVAPGDRFAYWREVICAVYVQLDAEPLGTRAFHGSIRADAWSDVTISRVTAGAQQVTHPESDARDDCLMSIQVFGTGQVMQSGRRAVVRPGDFAIYDATKSYQLRFDGPFEQLVMKFPRQLLLDRSIDIERAVAVPSAKGSGLTNVVHSLVMELAKQEGDVPADVRSQLGIQAVDCLASALSVMGFGSAAPETWQVARRRMVMEYIEGNYANPDLTIQRVANNFGCTTRSLQHLFADGPTLSSRLRSCRLDRAAEALVDPRLGHVTIARIGTDHGFRDPAAFARAFRREFGCSPSSARSNRSS